MEINLNCASMSNKMIKVHRSGTDNKMPKIFIQYRENIILARCDVNIETVFHETNLPKGISFFFGLVSES